MNKEWIYKVKEILASGQISSPRGYKIKEILNSSIKTDMSHPLLSIPERKLGYRFSFRESWHILDGRNDVESIKDYSKAISTFSDNGLFFFGSYGLRVLEQISYVVDMLEQDRDTRQAVLTIWRPNPRTSKDIPCTVSIQWLIRNNKIHCIDNMRSSDIWLGVPYDIPNFSMITGFIMLMLRERGIDNLELGTIYLNAGSQHLYEENWEKAMDLLDNYTQFDYQAFNPYEFDSPMDLKHYLKALSEKDSNKLDTYKSTYGRSIINA